MTTCLHARVATRLVRLAALVAAALVAACASTDSAPRDAAQPNVQYTFATPDEAGLSLANAAADLDGESLHRIFGPDIAMLSSGDSTQDDLDLQRFALAYDRGHSIRQDGPDVCSLVVGEQGWTFPVPIVRSGDRWYFDTAAGGTIVRAARIESNEATAVLALVALAGAEQVYFDMDPDGDGTKTFASRILSRDGTRDGLYWSDDLGGEQSPVGLGFAVADAANMPTPIPADGYLFRVLPPTGARASTTVSIVAFPSSYGETGRNTFVIVDGTVWRRDLGASTRADAMAMGTFAPDATWTRVDAK